MFVATHFLQQCPKAKDTCCTCTAVIWNCVMGLKLSHYYRRTSFSLMSRTATGENSALSQFYVHGLILMQT